MTAQIEKMTMWNEQMATLHELRTDVKLAENIQQEAFKAMTASYTGGDRDAVIRLTISYGAAVIRTGTCLRNLYEHMDYMGIKE